MIIPLEQLNGKTINVDIVDSKCLVMRRYISIILMGTIKTGKLKTF
jgi:hypothetical protein